MNEMELNIWGRKFNLEVVFDCYSGEDVTEEQTDAYKRFAAMAEGLVNDAKAQVELYCLDINHHEIGEKIDNIFKYVIPKKIYVARPYKNERIVALICAYKFNPDDGLAIVFKNEKLSEIGTENIVI